MPAAVLGPPAFAIEGQLTGAELEAWLRLGSRIGGGHECVSRVPFTEYGREYGREGGERRPPLWDSPMFGRVHANLFFEWQC